MARKFGLTTPIPPYPSINIGAADVYPIELIAAYSAFATLGTRTQATSIVRVENSKGDVLWEPTVNRVPVLSPQESWLMVSMMKDVVRRGTAAGSVGSQFAYPAGGKTGTTNEGDDVWFIGYTADLVAGVWMGLDKPQKIKGNAQGGQLAAPAWTAFMREVYRRKPAPPDWPRPDGIVTREIDPASGLLAGPGCASYTEYFIAGTDPIQSCSAPGGIYGAPGAPGATVDTAFGFPPLGSPPPRSPPPATPYPDTMRRTFDTSGSRVIPGATAPLRPSRPARSARDSMRPLPFDSIRIPRDTLRPPREISNPFRIPPA
jgi:penicillin-binding protein 1A